VNGDYAGKGACHAPLQGREEREGLPEGWKSVPFAKLISDGPKNGLYKHVRPIVQAPGFIKLTCESNMMHISLDQNQILPAYCIQFLNSFLGLSQLRLNVKHAVNQSSINQQDVKAVEVNLPPLPEQNEIVRRVEKLFASADRMEAHYTAARVQVEKLTPSLLNKAFSGELVEQDLTDESAAVLLERIRASKAPSPLPLSRRARERPCPCPKTTAYTAGSRCRRSWSRPPPSHPRRGRR